MFWFKLKEILFGNWRNKGVALFFAVIIWLVAYQTETQQASIRVHLVPTPRNPGQVIIGQECYDLPNPQTPFNGYVELRIAGPRRLVEKLRPESGIQVQEVRLPVEAGSSSRTDAARSDLSCQVNLGAEAFPFVPPGVQIVQISPKTLLITLDAMEEREFPVEVVYQRIPEGMEVEAPRIEPAATRLQGPRSLLDRIHITAEPWIGAAERIDESVPLFKRYPETVDKTLVEQTVRFLGPSQARLSLRLRYKSDSFDADGVRVRFLVPATRPPFRIQFDEDTVKVRFQGPAQEIRRLRDRVKDPDFALAVRVPATTGGEVERTSTFTEDGLLLYGFSERVQILQHPERQAQGKGAWTYSIIPVPPPERLGGE